MPKPFVWVIFPNIVVLIGLLILKYIEYPDLPLFSLVQILNHLQYGHRPVYLLNFKYDCKG